MIKSVIGLIAFSLCLISVGALSQTITQKSTVITINGDDVNHPIDCKGEFTCLLRESGISFVYAHGSDNVTVFNVEDFATVCAIGTVTGKDFIVSTLHEEHTCSR